MALSPDDVLNKTFTTTQFRRGYDEREVDDFLDDIVVEMRRASKDVEELRGQLDDCREGRGLEPLPAAAPAGSGELDAEVASLRDRNAELEGKVKDGDTVDIGVENGELTVGGERVMSEAAD